MIQPTRVDAKSVNPLTFLHCFRPERKWKRCTGLSQDPVKANIMPENSNRTPSPQNGSGVLLWDMAGTLIPFDSMTGRASALPGCEAFLPELGKDFRLVVTTGDETRNARNLLSGFGILSYFEDVFGDLYTPLGKPYGTILKRLGGQADCSVAIGDRLRADLPSDTDQVVTILINQKDEAASAGRISFLLKLLRKNGETFPEAFHRLTEKFESAPELVGELQGGEVTQAWNCHSGFDFGMMVFEHGLLDGERLVILI